MKSSLRQFLLADSIENISKIFLVCAVCFVLYLAGASSTAWTHPELLGTSVYIWNDPSASITSMLKKVFDWKAFDPNVNRVRPLNDFFEVIDAIARPFLIQWTQNVSFPLPSTILTIILVPVFLYGWAKRILGATSIVCILVIIIIMSTGFLSVVVSYIRPAKKLNILLLCAMLYYAERSRTDGTDFDFWKAIICCFMSFFADEQALINWLILSLLYWRECYLKGWRRTTTMIGLPLGFLVATKWILPSIYTSLSVHGRWDALADPKKFAVFAYLLDPSFYVAAITALGRSFLTGIGIKSQAQILVNLSSASVLLFPLVSWFRIRNRWSEEWLLISCAFIAASSFATLLDWYPFPYEVSYLGSFNYYYHSGVIVLIFCWLVLGWKTLFQSQFDCYRKNFLKVLIISTISIPIMTLAIYSNISLFYQVNSLVKIIHYYPYDAQAIAATLEKKLDLGVFVFQQERKKQTKQYSEASKNVFEGDINSAKFDEIFLMVQTTPIMTSVHLSHMVKSYFPWKNSIVKENSDLPQKNLIDE